MCNTNKPHISILLPVRDAHATLVECLLSIRRQTFHNYELLVIDDHSRDGSAQLVSARAKRDPRIRLLRNPGHGLIDALNHGLRQARAPLVARMDADDKMHARRLELQYRHLVAHPGLALVACQARLFPEQHIDNGFREYMRWQNNCLTTTDIAEEIYIESPFAHPSVVFRRQAVLDLGGYRDGDFPEDYELWLRMFHAGHRMAKLPRVLLDWRDSPGRTSRTHPRYAREAFDRLRATYLARDPRLHHGRPLAFWGAGRKTRKRARLLQDQGFAPTAWIDIDPKKIGNRIHRIPVVGPGWLTRQQRPFVLSYVTNHGARDDIAAQLQARDYQRGRDYLMVG
jgi:cellulose synthase/poly-beta-1,6-N-acetylglucosamine synthase-like glycosyltransferase